MKRVRKYLLLMIVTILSCQLTAFTVFGHSGRTDSNGGHKDNKNVSGLGSYHYHHGYGPHLHTNGLCPYETPVEVYDAPSIDISVLKSVAEDEGYNAGYKDGQAGFLKDTPQYDGEYEDSFNTGYQAGYEKGKEVRMLEIEAVKTKAEEEGYQAGYQNLTNTEIGYSDIHKEEYRQAYKSAYEKGKRTRRAEIKKVQDDAKSLGKMHGYNKEPYSIQYDGIYEKEYQTAYEEGLRQGKKELEVDLAEAAFKNYKLGVLGIKNIDEDYQNNFLKEASVHSYNEGYNIYTELITNRAVLGQDLNQYEQYAEDKTHIQIGLSDIKEQTIIAINDQSSRKVQNIQIFIDRIVEQGFNVNETETFLNNLLSDEVVQSYKEQSSQKKSGDNTTYYITKLKRVKKVEKGLPRKIYIITKVKDDKVLEIEISNKIPSSIKKLETIK